MEKLRHYLNGLSTQCKAEFAERCNTSIGYLRKALSRGERLGESLCIDIERFSGGEVTVEDLRPDLNEHWAYLRGSRCGRKHVERRQSERRTKAK